MKEKQSPVKKKEVRCEKERKKHTTPGIRWSSPTQLLVWPSLAYLWESGRDPEFSSGYGRMCFAFEQVELIKLSNWQGWKSCGVSLPVHTEIPFPCMARLFFCASTRDHGHSMIECLKVVLARRLEIDLVEIS